MGQGLGATRTMPRRAVAGAHEVALRAGAVVMTACQGASVGLPGLLSLSARGGRGAGLAPAVI